MAVSNFFFGGAGLGVMVTGGSAVVGGIAAIDALPMLAIAAVAYVVLKNLATNPNVVAIGVAIPLCLGAPGICVGALALAIGVSAFTIALFCLITGGGFKLAGA